MSRASLAVSVANPQEATVVRQGAGGPLALSVSVPPWLTVNEIEFLPASTSVTLEMPSIRLTTKYASIRTSGLPCVEPPTPPRA